MELLEDRNTAVLCFAKVVFRESEVMILLDDPKASPSAIPSSRSDG